MLDALLVVLVVVAISVIAAIGGGTAALIWTEVMKDWKR